MARPEGLRGTPRPPMPGGGGIGLPLCERGRAAPGGRAPGGGGGACPGAGGRGGAALGAPDGGAGRAAGAGPPAAAGGGAGRACPGAGGRGGAGGVGRAAAAGRAGPSSSARRGGAGRSLPDDVTRRPGGVGLAAGGAAGGGAGSAASAGAAGCSGAAGAAAAGFAAAFLGSAAFLAGAFFAFGGSSGWTSRMRPSRSALRRTRSACASSMLEECVLTPIPSERQRSSVSLFVMPSSFASSCTRIFGAKFLVQSFAGVVVFNRSSVGAVRPLRHITAFHPRTNRAVRTTLVPSPAVSRRGPSGAHGPHRVTRATAAPSRGRCGERPVRGSRATRRRAKPLVLAVYDRSPALPPP